MSKFTKLANHPVLFFKDAYVNFFKSSKSIVPQNNELSSKVKIKKNKSDVCSAEEILNFFWESDEVIDDKVLFIDWNCGESKASKDIMFNDGLVKVKIFHNSNTKAQRDKINNFSLAKVEEYNSFLLNKLSILKERIVGVVVEDDSDVAIKQLICICKILEIPTFLLIDKIRKHLYSILENPNKTSCDWVLVSNPNNFRMNDVLSDKVKFIRNLSLDASLKYKPEISKHVFDRIYNSNSKKKVILFVSQTINPNIKMFDNEKEDAVFYEIMNFSERNDFKVIYRSAISINKILNKVNLKRALSSQHVFFDDNFNGISNFNELCINSDLVILMSDWFFYEALILSKSLWIEDLLTEFDHYSNLEESKTQVFNVSSLQNKLADFFLKDDDQNAGKKYSIEQKIELDFEQYPSLVSMCKNLAKISKNVNDVVLPIKDVIPSFGTLSFHIPIVNQMKFAPAMLGFTEVICADTINQAVNVDLFCKWGLKYNSTIRKQDIFSKKLRRKQIIVEDGFLRSVDIGLSGEAGLSIIVDDKTAYYDATRESRLERRLNSDYSLSIAELDRAKTCIEEIKKNKLSKYNHAPYIPDMSIGENRSKVLLIDQRYGDLSVEKGLADETTFKNMLLSAIRENPDSDIVIKRHPDAVKGGKSSYYSDENIKFTNHIKNVYLIDYDINPHSLFNLMDKIYVVTSGMGFEALISGCRDVHVFGAPFYAGWGNTEDRRVIQRRDRPRSVNELFFFSYIESSFYINPYTEAKGEIEDVIRFISEKTSMDISTKNQDVDQEWLVNC